MRNIPVRRTLERAILARHRSLWLMLFRNLRSTRETELAEDAFPDVGGGEIRSIRISPRNEDSLIGSLLQALLRKSDGPER